MHHARLTWSWARSGFAINQPMEETTRPVKVLDAAPLSDAEKIKIYQTNAERVFNLVTANRRPPP